LGIGPRAVMKGCIAPIAADLDGDGQLEVLFGHNIRRANGADYWTHQIVGAETSVPLVAQLDDTPELEIVLSTNSTLYVLSYDGMAELAKMPYPCGGSAISVHDFDGDGRDELALPGCEGMGRASLYTLEADKLVARWSVADGFTLDSYSALASFDLRGQGEAELLYADGSSFALYAGTSGALHVEGMSAAAATFGTPVVADVDGDGRAEVLVPHFDPAEPGLLTVLGEANGRWANARRIWNQHAYHVTNVHEDARIPAGVDDAPAWPLRMRANALRQDNALCVP
jgi:hypothetical protein